MATQTARKPLIPGLSRKAPIKGGFMKVRRRLHWAKSPFILKGFRTAHERDTWILQGASREIIDGKHPLVRKANRSGNTGPCEITLED